MGAIKEEFVKARVDARKKRKAARILRERGLNLSSFIRSMLYVVAETGRVPFPQPPYEPNAETAAAIRDYENGVEDPGEERFSSFEDFKRSLGL